MKKKFISNLLLWVFAFLITVFSAGYQRRTGPTYPIEGALMVDGNSIDYKLLRSHGGEGDQPVEIAAPDTAIAGVVVYKRYKSNDDWMQIPMHREGNKLVAALPHQPPAGKLEYHVELQKAGAVYVAPDDENVVTRFKGNVPAWILAPHILFIFLSMLFAARVGLQALRKEAPVIGLMMTSVIFLILGGFIFGPIVQKFAFGAYWTGFPFGMDLTDNKTLIALAGWLLAFFLVKRNPRMRLAVLGAFIIMFSIFMIPHSMHGSELDYSKTGAQNSVVGGK